MIQPTTILPMIALIFGTFNPAPNPTLYQEYLQGLQNKPKQIINQYQNTQNQTTQPYLPPQYLTTPRVNPVKTLNNNPNDPFNLYNPLVGLNSFWNNYWDNFYNNTLYKTTTTQNTTTAPTEDYPTPILTEEPDAGPAGTLATPRGQTTAGLDTEDTATFEPEGHPVWIA